MAADDALNAVFSALADPTRRHILGRLAGRDATVKELAASYAMSLAAVSKHLKVLQEAGLISRSREAQFRRCHLRAEPLRGVADWLEDYRAFWERSFERLGDYLKTLQDGAGQPPAGRPRRRGRGGDRR